MPATCSCGCCCSAWRSPSACCLACPACSRSSLLSWSAAWSRTRWPDVSAMTSPRPSAATPRPVVAGPLAYAALGAVVAAGCHGRCLPGERYRWRPGSAYSSTPGAPAIRSASRRWQPWCGWQVAILIAIYGMWQWVGSLALVGSGDGLERGRRLWDLERSLGLPSEKSFQALFLPHVWLIKFFNVYYVIAHYNFLLLTLGWLFWRHRDRYREARTVIALATFACLAVQLIPVAPPRLIGGHGIVDTATQVRAVRLRPGRSGLQRSVLGDAFGAHLLVVGRRVLHLALDQEPLALHRYRARAADLDGRRRHRQPLLAGRHRRYRPAHALVLDGAPDPLPGSPGVTVAPVDPRRPRTRSRTRYRIGALVLAAVLGLTAAGCGRKLQVQSRRDRPQEQPHPAPDRIAGAGGSDGGPTAGAVRQDRKCAAGPATDRARQGRRRLRGDRRGRHHAFRRHLPEHRPGRHRSDAISSPAGPRSGRAVARHCRLLRRRRSDRGGSQHRRPEPVCRRRRRRSRLPPLR